MALILRESAQDVLDVCLEDCDYNQCHVPLAKPQPGEPKPSRARIWCMTKRQVRELLLSYHMESPKNTHRHPLHTPL